ncbi:TonB-dependent receptor [Caulobacter sp. D4A]|uniref:TonB-dependent receptor n=1 Tax=unclassified Caulobacter TaxID=2648921 RepID=UPI000D72FEEF|nr:MULTISPECIES: TonB-dependent receptor [unclassified Caulobacter]PXA90457.1 TonB-dependent receptor [Caulobacter sp. D4A]PXA96938.1 TonB-dependent receptor [Caulobacter sp. D5]
MTSNRNPRLRAVLGASASAFTLLAAAHAAAQEAPAPAPAQPASDEVEAIVVTGFRASLQSAINLKRNESGVVDAIKAEDIAQFPDLNLAESLQRIPGVSISRINGEGRQITVRGLGSEYTRVRINGMEAISTTGGTANSGGTNRGRGFDFNVFASDLFNSIAVRKTASADVEEGSLGATVDLTTARAFDSRKPQLVLSAGASYNDLSEKTTPRVSVLASNTFFDGKVGALISVAYEERHLKEEGANITRWATGASNGGFNSASTVPGYTIAQINSANLFAPRIPAYVSYDIESKRLGVAGSLQYKPTSDTQVTLDALYAYLAGTRKEAQLQAIGLSRANTGKPQTIIRDGVIENGNLVYARMDNVDLRTQSAYDELNTEFKQFTLSATHDFNERLRIGGLAGYSDSTFTQPVSTIVTFDRANSQNYVYDFRKGRAPQILLGFDATDPTSWASTNGTSEVRIRPQFVENQFSTAKVYGEWDLNDNLRLKAGVDWRKFEYDSYGQYRTSETAVQTLTPAQLASVSKVFSGFGRNMDLPAGNFTSWLVPDIDKYAALLNIYSNSGIYALTDTNNSSARGQYGAVEEQDTGAYVQAEFKFNAFGLPFRGDAGVRRVHTQQESAGYAAVSGAIQRVEVKRDYDLTLPSFNLAADVSDTIVARVSAAQTIARPGIGSLSPGGDVAVQGANRTYSSGNPYLTPTKSDNLDFSLEWYPSQGAMLAVGLFYKRIDTFVATLRREAVYNTLGLPDSLLTGTGATSSEVFQVTQPVNSDGGDLKGFEINLQQPFTFLPGFWRHFGVVANYTYVDSQIEYLTSTTPGAPTVNATLVGLSKNAANLTLYYETEKWSVRGSLAYRDGYLTQVPGSDGNTVQGTNETLNVDLQASWNIRDNLKLSLEGVNLTDEFNDQYVGDSNRLNVYTHSGRQFLVGLRYNF